MESKAVHNIIFVCVGLVILILIFGALHWSKRSEQPLHAAQESYAAAINASDIIQREEALNKTLRIYASLEGEYHPIYGNGKLYNNIAETFFQLEQYPWAALYFYQARALMPRDHDVEQSLQNTLGKLNVSLGSQDSIFRKVFFFHYYFSLPEQLQILSGITVLLFCLASLYVWKNYRFLKGLIAAVLLLWAVFFGSVIYAKYFEPLEGMIVNASMLYRGSSVLSPFVDPKPIMEGRKVEVLDVLEDGKWLKIRTPEGNLGFISSESIRIIRI